MSPGGRIRRPSRGWGIVCGCLGPGGLRRPATIRRPCRDCANSRVVSADSIRVHSFPSASEKPRHRFGAGADLKLFVDAADVGMDRFVTDSEFVGDLLVEESAAETIEHLLFAGR
jgi:hypothetical protein